MKKNLYLLALALSFSILVSCGDDDEPEVNLLVGTWELDDIMISDPPSGYSLEQINTEPNSTLLSESSYVVEFKGDFTYVRMFEDASLVVAGNVIEADLVDDGEWERGDDRIDLDQENVVFNDVPTTFSDIPTRFDIVELDADKLVVTATDVWVAWPPLIANDEVALDTLDTSDEFNALLLEYAEIQDMTFRMEFDKQQ